MGKSQTSLERGSTNIQHCKQCNAELASHARFCSICGAVAKSVDAQAVSQGLEEYEVVPKWKSIGKSTPVRNSVDTASSSAQVTHKDEAPDKALIENDDVQDLDAVAAGDSEDEEVEDDKSYTQPHLSAVIANIGRRQEAKEASAPTPNRQETPSVAEGSKNSSGYGIEDYDTMMLSSYAPVPKALIHEASTVGTVAVEKSSVESQPISAIPQIAEALDMEQTQDIPAIGTVGKKSAAVPLEQRETQRVAAPALSESGLLESAEAVTISSGIWSLLLIVAAIATALLVYVTPGLPIRPYVVLAFLILCPGMALIRLMRLRDVAVEWTLAIALSIVLDALIPTAQLYAHLWSPNVTLAIILVITVMAALAQFINPRGKQKIKLART